MSWRTLAIVGGVLAAEYVTARAIAPSDLAGLAKLATDADAQRAAALKIALGALAGGVLAALVLG